MIDASQQHHLDQHADRGDDQRRGDDAAPESERARKTIGQCERDIGTEHIERAMREIHDPCHAEDDRQSRGDQKQRRRAGETGQELDEIEGHGGPR
jgi:spore cortex formation protein SpoVR/YcgB (stage V sporulation)